MDINKQKKEFFVVVRKNIKIPLDKIKSFLEGSCLQYAFIEHENDIKPNSGGIVEGVHYHLVMILPKRKRGYTLLNDICEFFNFSNNHGIEVEPLNSLEGAIQYLTHKNDKDKTQHDFKDIISNIPKEELFTLYEMTNNSLTFDRVLYILNNSEDLLDVIQNIGFARYHIYRNTIKDMWVCLENRKIKSKLPF